MMTLGRRAEASALAEEVLTDIELGKLRPTDIVRKASRLARLLDDTEALEWLLVEIRGYASYGNKDGLPKPAWSAAERSGRVYTDDDGTRRARTASIAELQAIVEGSQLQLSAAADAPVSVSSANPSQYVSLPQGNTVERINAVRTIRDSQNTLETVIGAVHQYVMERSYELRFGSAVESTFERIRSTVDAHIAALVPDALRKLTAAIELAASENPEHWADAAGYCRRLIKAVADALQPAGQPIGGRANGENNYINRLAYWIEKNETSSTARDVMVSDLEYFGRRLAAFTDAGNKGAHATVEQYDADRFIIGTYILLGDILRLPTDKNGEPSEWITEVAAPALSEDGLGDGQAARAEAVRVEPMETERPAPE
ncbi:conserved hypothetical protein [Rhodococcus ruber]|uniref:AbiTii domain-containing protein n=2 Tax=Nocardiaceae TaxID=85025 RepID=A0A098BUC8_9NOCA|nr:conserved hypothetical protein [Rhodococcus ruber]